MPGSALIMLSISTIGRIAIDCTMTDLILTQSQSGTRVWDRVARGWVPLPKYRYRLFDQDELADLESSLKEYLSSRSSDGV